MPAKQKNNQTKKTVKEQESHIFLSHAAADTQLADVLADLIRLGCDVPAKRIFCTSLEGMGIPAGKQFPDFIKERIQEPALVIALLTPSYLASEFCLCELGATWAMGHDFFPLIVKPANRSKMKGVLTGVHIEKIEDDAGLDNLRDRILATMSCEVATALWTAKRDAFLKSLPDALNGLAIPKTVDRSELDEVKASYDAAVEEVSEKDAKIGELEEIIGKLKKCTKSEEFREVMRQYSNEDEEFEELVDSAAKALGQLNGPTQEAIYQNQRGEPLYCLGSNPVIEGHDAEKDVECSYLSMADPGIFHLRADHPAVAKALSVISTLSSFLDMASPEFLEALKEEHQVPVELSNRAFWNKILV